MDYKTSGVDIEKADEFIRRIKKKIIGTYTDAVVEGLGGFCALYDIGGDKLLASGTDGVGTKVLLAIELDKHDTIGIDLLAMCVNDILCSGARPLFFLDYLAFHQLDLSVSEAIIEGLVNGVKQAQMALVGGETAEMPGVYPPGHYDLAGFAVGEVMREDVVSGKEISAGDQIFGIPASGFHSNGFSLIRKIIASYDSRPLREALLTPTRIYTKEVLELKNTFKKELRGLSHNTGGGIENLVRLNSDFTFEIKSWPHMSELPLVFTDFFSLYKSYEAAEKGQINPEALFRTFNMGIGMFFIIPKKEANKVKELSFRTYHLGEIRKGGSEKLLLGPSAIKMFGFSENFLNVE